ncbi:MAG: flavin reductase family protein [Clostridia bacterium]
MNKQVWKGTTALSPLPAVLVSVSDENKSNIITIAWTGIISSDPPRAYISVRPNRYSYKFLSVGKEFVINLVPRKMLAVADWCGFVSGEAIDKFKEMRLTKGKGSEVSVPLIDESPVNLECKIFQQIDLGSHTMFMADILAVDVADSVVVDGKLSMEKADLISYQHGEYYATGEQLARFGFSIQKKFIKYSGKGITADTANSPLVKRLQPRKRKK